MKKEFKIIAQIINNNKKVLDIGCGDGTLMEYLKKNQKNDVRGLEPKKDKRFKEGTDVIKKGTDVQEKPRYSDNKVPVKRETFTQNMDDGTKVKYRAITRLDGSVYFQVIEYGGTQFMAASKKLNIKAGENITPKQATK